MNSTSITSGIQNITQYLSDIPNSPGVYMMQDKDKNILYVGKAKNLSKRVTNYTMASRLEYRIQNMVSRVVYVDIITTRNEIEALLLEANLIKKYEPKYNILLKDDKSYPYILITQDHDFPRIVKHRGKKSSKGKYYGPFPSAHSVNQAIADIQKAFLLRPCSDSFFASRKRPCIEYQIKRCSAPCTKKITKDEYQQLTKQATSFLKGKSRELQEELVFLMERASDNMDYEKAASYRDRIKALNQIQAKQQIHIENLQDADIIGLYRVNDKCCIQLIFFRGGRNLGSKPFYPIHIQDNNENDILSAFILQFYNDNPPPTQIITHTSPSNKTLLQNAISDMANNKITINTPKSGEKKLLLDQAIKLASENLHKKIMQNITNESLLSQIEKFFELLQTPKRIEIYDNSHISGKYDLGVMVVADKDGFNKKAYRRFNIKGDIKGSADDFAMLKQILYRRFKNVNQKNNQTEILPDFMLIDGGAGQMSATLNVLKELKLDTKIKFACIAKGPQRNAGREDFFMPGKKPFQLPHDSELLYYLQTLRDEAHRFAIGSHRKRRDKSTTTSILDEIPNIGTKRKKLLLNHFGSAKSISGATLEELMQVDGINRNTAKIIFDYLNN